MFFWYRGQIAFLEGYPSGGRTVRYVNVIYQLKGHDVTTACACHGQIFYIDR